MKDNFKKFVNEQRKEFDIYDVEDDGWLEIEKSLDRQERFSISLFVKLAATFLIVAAIGVTWYAQRSSQQLPQQVIELEAYYGTLTKEKIKYIKSHNKEIDPVVWQDLDTLNKTYQALKEDLEDDIDNEEVVTAMIQTYRAKLQLLEQILDEIKNESKPKKHDEVSI